MAVVVLCTLDSARLAFEAANDLKANGFLVRDISVLIPEIAILGPPTYQTRRAGREPGLNPDPLHGDTIDLSVPAPFIAAGPLRSVLNEATGRLTDVLISLGLPEYEARYYDARLKLGSTIVGIHSGDSLRAQEILLLAGAEDITVTTREPENASLLC